jgi:diketogulonate reductase-like aldo/keto reductase
MSHFSSNVTVGFGTAALGGNCHNVVLMALEAGFRRFDTAEADWWYDQQATGTALQRFFMSLDEDCDGDNCRRSCKTENLQVSTKIPPWSLTSASNIRQNAANSRRELVGFCDDEVVYDETGEMVASNPFPLDIYYIHAPRCWDGWHPRCKDAPPTLELRDAWKAMEAVVGIDGNARRIGLSNVWPNELLDIIRFVDERDNDSYPPPRKPDVVQAFADPISPNTELRRVCEEHGITFVSYSTLGTQHGGSTNPVLGSSIIQGLSAKHGRSVAEVVLSWALQRNMSVIPRSSKKEHIAELANLINHKPFLDEADLLKIDGMKQSTRTS